MLIAPTYSSGIFKSVDMAPPPPPGGFEKGTDQTNLRVHLDGGVVLLQTNDGVQVTDFSGTKTIPEARMEFLPAGDLLKIYTSTMVQTVYADGRTDVDVPQANLSVSYPHALYRIDTQGGIKGYVSRDGENAPLNSEFPARLHAGVIYSSARPGGERVTPFLNPAYLRNMPNNRYGGAEGGIA